MGEAAQRIVIPYSPRLEFLPFHSRKQRFACLVMHRRAGKTVAVVNDLIRDALTCQKPNPRVAYIAPFYSQAKDVAWEYAKYYTSAIPGTKAHEAELRIDFPNGGRFRLYGADNYDRLRGIYLDAVGLDEPADFPINAWPMVIRPALADRQGKATFIGTPKGKNEFHRIWTEAQKDDAWFSAMLKASESGILDKQELLAAHRDMGEDRYQQEFECSFEAAIQGAYYGQEIQQAQADQRITRVPYERGSPVHTAWDLGIDDATAIWFAQRVGREVRVIDYYEASGMDAAHYAGVCRDKGYQYGEHLLPHDAGKREIGTGETYEDLLNKAELPGTTRVLHRTQDLVGDINKTREFLSICYFDAGKCDRGIEALRQYRREFDEKLKTWRRTPLHDWSSHSADAFRALAVGMKVKDDGWGEIEWRGFGTIA